MGCASSIHTPIIQPSKHPIEEEQVIPASAVPAKVSVLLNPGQKEAIRSSWALLGNDLERIGKQIFLKIFETNPQIKELFSFRCAWGDQLINHPDFKSHAARFMNIIQEGVNHLDDLDHAYTPRLLSLGSKHTKFYGFKSAHFVLFHSAILFILRRELLLSPDSEADKAWNVFLRYLMNNMQEGYNESKRNVHALENHGYLVHSDTV